MARRGFNHGIGDGLYHKPEIKNSFADQQPLDFNFASGSSNSFMGTRAMFRFGAGEVSKSGNSFYHSFGKEDSEDIYLDEYFNYSEKKRRLTVDQVQFLEKSFVEENKLEPERKNKLATDLGLQPRQIAIWFQNRRARSRTKQVETGYDMLYARYSTLKKDYDNLLKENENLKVQVLNLKGNTLSMNEENEKSLLVDGNAFPISSIEKSESIMVSKDDETVTNEDQNLVKTDAANIVANGMVSSHPELGNCLHSPDPDLSDISHYEGDNLSDELLQGSYVLPKIEDAYCHTPAHSWNFSLSIEDHGFGFWSL